MPEEEIIAGLLAGGSRRHAALRAWIVGPVGAQMQRFFIHKGIAEQDAKDVLQDTIVNVVTKLHTYRADGAAKSWLWQVARNCMADFYRKSGGYERMVADADALQSAKVKAANDAVVSHENGTKVIRFPYVAVHENSRAFQSVPRQVQLDDEQWRIVAETRTAENPVNEGETVDECVDRGLDEFMVKMPERGLALNMQMEGSSISEIAATLGRTVGATKEFLSQCRKQLQPFIARCTDLLTP